MKFGTVMIVEKILRTVMGVEQGGETSATQTRRHFLKTASGIGATATVFGTTAAGSDEISIIGDANTPPKDYPMVSTRDHFDRNGNLNPGYSPTEYEKVGNWQKYRDGSDSEVIVFIHGWTVDEPWALEYTCGCAKAFEQNNYDEFVVGFSWDADYGDSLSAAGLDTFDGEFATTFWGIDLRWEESVIIAKKNGKKLAEWITDHLDGGGDPVRLVGHSLGVQVLVSALSDLQERGRKDAVESATFLGGAIDEESVEIDETYGQSIENVAKRCDNFLKWDDQKLGLMYRISEMDGAVGQFGIDNPFDAPQNYSDVNVTDQVTDHDSYPLPDDGCIPQVVETF